MSRGVRLTKEYGRRVGDGKGSVGWRGSGDGPVVPLAAVALDGGGEAEESPRWAMRTPDCSNAAIALVLLVLSDGRSKLAVCERRVLVIED